MFNLPIEGESNISSLELSMLRIERLSSSLNFGFGSGEPTALPLLSGSGPRVFASLTFVVGGAMLPVF